MWFHTDEVGAFYWAAYFCFPGKCLSNDAALAANAKTQPRRGAEPRTIRKNEVSLPNTFVALFMLGH